MLNTLPKSKFLNIIFRNGEIKSSECDEYDSGEGTIRTFKDSELTGVYYINNLVGFELIDKLRYDNFCDEDDPYEDDPDEDNPSVSVNMDWGLILGLFIGILIGILFGQQLCNRKTL